jgi:hypothetical protein
MDPGTCRVCDKSMQLEETPIIGRIVLCDHCSSIYQVVQTDPFELLLIGNTGDLENKLNWPADR